ncbi:MAG TPA: class I SAM-dependent methyltransferase [Candidatus Megaira endosymbiont of Hartmannula sinica]|nr:class I SAM-dependent methyltransferase [Candidatus Megaera endosymbiont of Hartmannula sinica]
MALKYKNAEIVGIDLSSKQIEHANRIIKALSLKNIKCEHLSIDDVDNSLGKFDYIIVHGILSWVPEKTQKKIFEIFSNNLTKDGIAYVSYNTLPGWNMVNTVRDMMNFHTSGFKDPNQKLQQSKLILKFITDSIEGHNTPYSNMLKEELKNLSDKEDNYLFHDHINTYNTPFYFKDIALTAAKNDLQYLGDSSLASMYIGNLPKMAQEKLSKVNNILQLEQYSDFIRNRRFRSSLFCHNSVKINRNINNSQIKDFAIKCNVFKDIENPIDITSNEKEKIYLSADKKRFIETSSPAQKAIFECFSENPTRFIDFDYIVKKSNSKFKDVDMSKQITAMLLNNMMNMVIRGVAEISLFKTGSLAKIDKNKPKANPLALYQAKHEKSNFVTTTNHTPLNITPFHKVAITYMDGSNTKEEIVDEMLKH